MWRLQKVRTDQRRETFTSHETPSRPWQFVAADLFELNGKSYLVTVDYFSDFFGLNHLRSTSSVYVIRKLKGHFAKYGIPEQLIPITGHSSSRAISWNSLKSGILRTEPAVHIIVSRMERLRAPWSKPRKFCWCAARLVQTRFLLYSTTETHRPRICKSVQHSGYLAEGQEVSCRWLPHY